MNKGKKEEQSNLIPVKSHSTSPGQVTPSNVDYSDNPAHFPTVTTLNGENKNSCAPQAPKTEARVYPVFSQVAEPYIQNPMGTSTITLSSPLSGYYVFTPIFQAPFLLSIPHNPVLQTSPFQAPYTIPVTSVTPPPSTKTMSDPAPVTRCTCRKTHCLKLYCECLKAGKVCSSSCSCVGCLNQEGNEARKKTINFLKLRNVKAYKRLVSVENSTGDTTTCSCKRSNCKKKYCSCFLNGKKCTNKCSCFGCQNK